MSFWVNPVSSAQNNLQLQDIHRVMEKFYALHITNKELSPLLIRRAMKIYIENFDAERAYLLESEVRPYLSLSDKKAQEIVDRVNHRDYSDFIALNQLIQKAIVRAESQRQVIMAEMVKGDGREAVSNGVASHFARTEDELVERQRNRMARFYAFHKARSNLDTPDRKEKVCFLFEKKVRKSEYNYLFFDQAGATLPKNKSEHLMTMRILKALAKSLDTHTTFFSPEEAQEMRHGLEKQFEGVGVVLAEGIDGIVIADVIQGSPAQASGQIQVNDFLVEIDRIPVQSISFDEVMELLKKKGKEEILLGFKRPVASAKKEIFYRVPLKKQPIEMNEERIQTSYEQTDKGIIGKIALHSFYENGDGVSSEKDIKEAITSFRKKGNLVGLVLDLRENAGGFLSQAVKVTGLFVANGVVVISKYGKGETNYLRNIAGKSFYNGPLVVLTSRMSASAAEIVAQALQDYGVALVVGDPTTFGKGSIQYQTVTDPNADVFFKVTVGRYYTVSGKSTQIDGVIADIVVPTPYAPYNIGERFLEYPLPQDKVEAAYVDSLDDLDDRAKRVFEVHYMPYLQRAVSFWKRQLPTLKQNSADRMSVNPGFQSLMKRQEAVRSRLAGIPVNTIDESVQNGMDDLQMNEAVNIVKDMIQIESAANQTHTARFLKTGS
ncbi:MAG TPA: S41 family peptidase [Chlamydiales bacterium]|nr:S41 family peptidase [Chlamydiales bacterium]